MPPLPKAYWRRIQAIQHSSASRITVAAAMMIFIAALAEGVAYVPDRVFVKRCYLHGYLYPFPCENTGGRYGPDLVPYSALRQTSHAMLFRLPTFTFAYIPASRAFRPKTVS